MIKTEFDVMVAVRRAEWPGASTVIRNWWRRSTPSRPGRVSYDFEEFRYMEDLLMLHREDKAPLLREGVRSAESYDSRSCFLSSLG